MMRVVGPTHSPSARGALHSSGLAKVQATLETGVCTKIIEGLQAHVEITTEGAA